MSSTNKTTYYELSQYIGTDKPTYLSDYNGDMLKIDTGIHDVATDASTAVSTANSAASAAATASTNASAAVTTANTASATALEAKTTAETASTNASAALTAAEAAETAAEANTIGNLAPAYDPTLTYAVDDLVTYIDDQGSGKLYKCIIAVDTPEAFNINKWDDVTTSEIYNRKSKVINTATADGVKTYRDIYNELMTNVSVDINSEYILTRQTSPTSRSFYHNSLNYSDTNIIAFTFSFISGNSITVREIHLTADNTANRVTNTANFDGTYTSVESSTDIVSSGSVFTLIKLTTI